VSIDHEYAAQTDKREASRGERYHPQFLQTDGVQPVNFTLLPKFGLQPFPTDVSCREEE
jgi:hypothetical protein